MLAYLTAFRADARFFAYKICDRHGWGKNRTAKKVSEQFLFARKCNINGLSGGNCESEVGLMLARKQNICEHGTLKLVRQLYTADKPYIFTAEASVRHFAS